jgi:predicted RecB family nuclease
MLIKSFSNINWKYMISASSVRNYMLNDPLIDYLKEYNITKIQDIHVHNVSKKKQRCKQMKNITKMNNKTSNNKPNKNKTFLQHILDGGVQFESDIIDIIKKNHKIVKVAEYTDIHNEEKYQETINLMMKGIPIIYQGLLYNLENNTYGLPDLLVRSDYINKLFDYEVITKQEAKLPSPNLNIPYHYKVIDIKHSLINLKADGIHILNSDCIPAYKGQLYIYTSALNSILGVNINKAFIWGKKYVYTCKKEKHIITNNMKKVGIIDYDTTDDEFVTLTNNAIEWLLDMKKNGKDWQLLPTPSKPELYPNMKNDMNSSFHHIKSELNEQLKDITSIWNCGYKKRIIAHQSNIYSWDDKRLNAKIMGFDAKSKVGKTIDKILNINRQEEDIIQPEKVTYDRLNWFNKSQDTQEFYLDFETLNDTNQNNSLNQNNTLIFMIGLGYMDKSGEWIFKCFVMKEKNKSSELEMFNDFYSYINNILINNNKTHSKFYHWSNAEVTMYNDFLKRNNNLNNNLNIVNHTFYDLNKVFVQEPIVVKDALNFSLKTIAKALHKNGLIQSIWDNNNECSNGLNAMIMAMNLYDERNIINNNKSKKRKFICDIEDEEIMKNIIHYNSIDCKVLWEIHELMRSVL